MATKKKKVQLSSLKKMFKPKGSKERARGRSVGTLSLLSAAGVVQGRGKKLGRGRPTGSYKHGMPIHEFKKLQAQRKEKYRQYQVEQMRQYQRRGISPDQLRQMQMQRTIEKGMPQKKFLKKGDEPQAMADDELAFKRWESERMLSPSAQAILLRLRRTQNKGKMDNIRQQRIHEERRIIDHKGNLMKAHENMVDVTMDFTGVDPETNILMAKNVFKEDAQDHILRQRRLNIMQTREAGNDLGF